jgi:hypothetical protein
MPWWGLVIAIARRPLAGHLFTLAGRSPFWTGKSFGQRLRLRRFCSRDGPGIRLRVGNDEEASRPGEIIVVTGEVGELDFMEPKTIGHLQIGPS